MAIARDLSWAQIAFQLDTEPIDTFQVIRYRGSEGLCQMYRVEIDLLAQGTSLVLDAMIGKPGVLSMNTPTGARYVHGIVGRMEVTGQAVGETHYRIELVPSLWLLTHRYHSRIFQGKKTKEIIAQILEEGGLTSDQFHFDLAEDPDPREYCVQYRETDYNFIARLMEEEGIWWHFEHTQDGHRLIMADSNDRFSPLSDEEATLKFTPPTGLHNEDDHVYAFRAGQSMRPGAVVLNDYDFENPPLRLEGSDNRGRDNTLEFVDFPGGFKTIAQGTSVAQRRREELESMRIQALGESGCRRLAPGKRFTLAEHPVESLNGEYLITTVEFEGKQAVRHSSMGSNSRATIVDGALHQSLVAARNHDNPTIAQLAQALLQLVSRLRASDGTARREVTSWLYHAGQVSRDLASVASASGANPLAWLVMPNLIEDIAHYSALDYDAPVFNCRFACIPAATTYRPARVTPWPVMRGTQTARVVGKEGEEIQTDEYGRVKVQFDWDREGNEGGTAKRYGADSSCWIRVSQPWAGGGYGGLFLPRIGQEVIVDFLEGNPDHPIIIGRVYNKDHMPPYELPKEKTKSVIKTNSSVGAEGCNEICFEDLKGEEQLIIQAQRQMDTRVKASHMHTVGGGYSLIVGGEKDGDLYGEYRQKVFKAKQVHVKGEQRGWVEENDGLVVGGDQSIEIQGGRSTSVGGDDIGIAGGNLLRDATGTAHIKGADIKIEASGTIELSAGGSSVVITGAGVYITGSTVYLNSGSGPSVSAVDGGVGPAAVEEPAAAAVTTPGRDVHYTDEGIEWSRTPAPSVVPGHEFESPEPEETTWIEIELVDQYGDPVPGEPFRLRDASERNFSGSLDENGFARVEGVVPGDCEIRFPNRDLTIWRRAT